MTLFTLRSLLLLVVWRCAFSRPKGRSLQGGCTDCCGFPRGDARKKFTGVMDKGGCKNKKCSFKDHKDKYFTYDYDSQFCFCFDKFVQGKGVHQPQPDPNDPCTIFSGIVGDHPSNGGGGGDPHIAKWTGERYNFHGECDLVLLHAPHFGHNNTGLNIHIRTTIRNHFSFIEQVAIQHGPTVVRVEGHNFYTGDHLRHKFPLTTGAIDAYRFHHKYGPENKTGTRFKIEVEKKQVLRINVHDDFLFVHVTGEDQDFGTSVGLMGEYGTGKTFGRDGLSEIGNVNEFGMEWQVRPTEPMLFRTKRAPQLPKEFCRMPSEASKSTQRNLLRDPALMMRAMKACSNVDLADVDNCVEDVVFTGDMSMAEAYLM